MNTRFRGALFLALLAALTLSGVDAQVVAPKFRGSSLIAPPRDWPTNGGDWYNRRYSPLSEISRSTSQRLKGVWRVRLNGSGFGPQYSAEAQPIYFGGVLYIATGANDVFAIDVDSGSFLWTYKANLDPAISTACCGWTNRGVALGDGKVYVGQLDGKLVALDQKTGKVVWSVQAERWQEGFTITSCAALLRRPRDHGLRRRRIRRPRTREGVRREERLARVDVLYDPRARRARPRHVAARQRGVAQRRRHRMADAGARSRARAHLLLDRQRRAPTSTAACGPATTCSPRRSSRSTCETGKYRWHFQEVHHDLWDYDAPNPVVLFDVDIDGVERKGFAQAGKTGWVYILDRTNGKPLIGIEERAGGAGAAAGDGGDAAVSGRRPVRAARRWTSRPRGSRS